MSSTARATDPSPGDVGTRNRLTGGSARVKTGMSRATGSPYARRAVPWGGRLRQTTFLQAMDWPMPALRPKRRRRPCVEDIEPRDPPAGLSLAGVAAAVDSSPVLSAARTAVLAYHVGQLAYTGHTSLLFGAVRVSQPFALKNLANGRRFGAAPVSIRDTRPSAPSSLAGERKEGQLRHGHVAIHKHGRDHGHRAHHHGHHRGRDH